MAVKITKKTSTHNTTASAGRAIKYIVIHYAAGVSSAKGKAANTAEYFAGTTNQASADFIVDDETIVQYNPDLENRYCWHCGGSKLSTKGGSLHGVAKNADSIGIEICSMNSTGKVPSANDKTWSFTDAVVAKAVELTRYLMEKYSIDADHVIRHYDVTGKLCPGIIGWNADSGDESQWKAFQTAIASGTADTAASGTVLYRVRKTWADSKSQKGAYKILANAKKCADKYEGYSVFDADGNVVYVGALTAADASESAETESFQVKVSISNLNIRTGPGTGFAKTGKYTGKGVFTIVETSEGTGSAAGWGLLKAYQSGRNGWISLEHAVRV
ncbi:MAG: N-acetylmuramoyl-L-alanine amidase [Lachnospiraceae bacterium]|nr:N-acetylmuramoyl-L-alanine amidase [Lachnospiraceae bacterium]